MTPTATISTTLNLPGFQGISLNRLREGREKAARHLAQVERRLRESLERLERLVQETKYAAGQAPSVFEMSGSGSFVSAAFEVERLKMEFAEATATVNLVQGLIEEATIPDPDIKSDVFCEICGATASGARSELCNRGWSFPPGQEICPKHD